MAIFRLYRCSAAARLVIIALGLTLDAAPVAWAQEPGELEEFCLRGEFDLGARLQGYDLAPGEFYPTSWCVTAGPDGGPVRSHVRGRSNADIDGEFIVEFLPPDTVRIVDPEGSHLDFNPVPLAAEAARHRRLNPALLLAETRAFPQRLGAANGEGWQQFRLPDETRTLALRLADDRVLAVRSMADMPLRGRVPIEWQWDWSVEPVAARLLVDGSEVFRGRGHWRPLEDPEVAAFSQADAQASPQLIPGDNWPARVGMSLERLAEDVYFVTGVRSGFNHLVVDTPRGLIVGDAPAGWVELHQIPPADLVPNLGVSGLSERFVDFLAAEFPGKAIAAVVLTHGHDDHSGGARALAAEGSLIYVPEEQIDYFRSALTGSAMPPDRFSVSAEELRLTAVTDRLELEFGNLPVILHRLDDSPHVRHALGIQVGNPGYFFQSDIHVPGADAAEPAPIRAATECWFARWAADNLSPQTVVLSSHSSARTPVATILNYLDSPACAS